MAGTLGRADSGIVMETKSARKPKPEWEEQEQPTIHPLVREVKVQVDEYVSYNWDFSDDETKRDFIDQNVSSVASYYFPSALVDRIFLVSRLLAVMFLIAGMCSKLRRDRGLWLIP